MIITSWRIVKSRRAKAFSLVNGVEMPEAFDGTGASLYPGRWNNKGIPLVYTAGSQSLATLEVLVHLEDSFLLESYSIFPVKFDDRNLVVLEKLPSNWQKNPPDQKTRVLGDLWFKANESLVLGVPSAIIPNEINYLINPYHPESKNMSIGVAQKFPFDSRLFNLG